MKSSCRRTLLCISGFALLAVALGCGKGSSTSTGSPATTGPAPNASGGGNGSAAFDQQCAKCHATEAGTRRGKGPNLAGIGSKPDKTLDWLVAHIKNPKTHSPMSGMPAFEGKMSEPDIKTVAEYLKTLK